ncbi:hypothetical protein [Paracoccus spongiarum]|uniref:PAS domain-containing protein n=1 Tax=Paracoccus spongiarum TaxID=3064387 RepID=A0ABT9JFX1_9RHOB|nr:hypothetical protein [Paracoccus sp. 2205BS29-5]MDP5308703.1 hypothetical protein [Paracoccus sp. 2205BS29-5]
MSPNHSGTISPRTRPPLCAITLIDRRTGRPHRVNGAALVLLSRDPDMAALELLAGRDTRIWDARIQPLPPTD